MKVRSKRGCGVKVRREGGCAVKVRRERGLWGEVEERGKEHGEKVRREGRNMGGR